MYSRQEASIIRKEFWTSFGQYMAPFKGAGGDSVNWINYKTGIRHLYFRMDADKKEAAIGIELTDPDGELQQYHFEQLKSMKSLLEEAVGEIWEWKLHTYDDNGKILTRIGTSLPGVSVFNRNDWPAIISFLKPRMLALDQFWYDVKDIFQ